MIEDPLFDLLLEDETAKWLYTDLKADRVRQVRKKRCGCGFFLTKVEGKHDLICAKCLSQCGSLRVKQKLMYGPFAGRTHFWVLTNEFQYCSDQTSWRKNKGYESSNLTHMFETMCDMYDLCAFVQPQK